MEVGKGGKDEQPTTNDQRPTNEGNLDLSLSLYLSKRPSVESVAAEMD